MTYPIGLAETGVKFGVSTENERMRILFFPLNSQKEMKAIYQDFIEEREAAGNLEHYRVSDFFFEIIPNDRCYKGKVEYASALLLGMISSDDAFHGNITDDERVRIRNEHLDAFVDHLWSREIGVAERLPFDKTNREKREHDGIVKAVY